MCVRHTATHLAHVQNRPKGKQTHVDKVIKQILSRGNKSRVDISKCLVIYWH